MSAIVIVLLGAGGWLWSRRNSAPAVEAGSQSGVKSTLHLDSFVVNLADPDQRSYLRVGIDLGLGRVIGKDDSVPVALVRDAILGVLSQKTAEDLLGAQGKEKLKDDLQQALNQRAPELDVREVYFTEFLIQR